MFIGGWGVQHLFGNVDMQQARVGRKVRFQQSLDYGSPKHWASKTTDYSFFIFFPFKAFHVWGLCPLILPLWSPCHKTCGQFGRMMHARYSRSQTGSNTSNRQVPTNNYSCWL